jgi:hypothetical protein
MSDSIASVGATNVCTFMNGPLAIASGGAPDTDGTTDTNLTWPVEPNGGGALDDGSEPQSLANYSGSCIYPFEAAFTDLTPSRSHLFPGHVADLRPTGSATPGEIEMFDLGVSGDVLVYTGDLSASSQPAVTHAANVVARSDIGGDGPLVKTRTSPEAAGGKTRILSRLRGKGQFGKEAG